MIDYIIGPLFKLNPFKYVFRPNYRSKIRMEIGRAADYVLIYQLLFFIACVALVLFVAYG